ncbi:Lrp/AsnC family transcriptional regulator [Phaeobacter sp. 22II1-1F12B]|uniref:Lrp/AsnC family transcriptional regulator n=1 Tax=Phaeobacter sp. 22II1-1F12B TaxID=1317111 RepID=UPI000B524AED|nr:Lrp/AsnC family transcriptional regulator [Phaeobacter sp. 22II1-1F12B]OWU73145.1 AsnC family transcriptional regulator [Phaeobacter sp. 22II1-1F12B]
MDKTDERLIAALKEDGRASISDLAASLNLSRTTVRTRLERLQASGDILGFSVVLKRDVASQPVRGLMMIGIEGRGTDRITRQLIALPQVRAVHSTNGRWDMIVAIGADTLEEFDTVLAQIRRFDGIAHSETNLLLNTKKAAR